ncbi:family 78 glycoside hydrolase catalytic domain [Mucilaginibacter myungsuensis]|uniref:alpha-L-rhamnosidase n=2 Tax=Mucilaginibacter myungsuensis TaxID=649104 RepID=A0A929L2B0_9SPHI|nr:family 78 glycoside hydrolase catalytic domain [Mucilaginibacter myungsuensis]
MTDLMAQPNYQSINGYATQSSPANLADRTIRSVLIGNRNPGFSWEMNSNSNNVFQTAYQILVADNLKDLTTDKGNVWDSGKISSASSSGARYKGTALKPSTAYYWKVREWDNKSQVSPYSKPQTFYTDTVLADHKSAYYPQQVTEEKPVKFGKVADVYRVDFGKDAFGQLKLRLYSDKETDTIRLRICEIVDANGNIDRRPPGTIRYAQYLLPLNKGWHHYKIKLKKNEINTRPLAIKMPEDIGEVTPFRYAEVEGYNHPLKADDITRLFVHYPFNDDVAKFHCSDSTLNAIWELCKYSMKATSYLGTYVDGDRERLAYEADAYINQLSHYAVDKEFSIARKTYEHLINTPTWPTEWILQSVLIGWNDYLYTGDISSAKYFYQDLKAKSLTALEDSTGLISTKNGKMTKELLKSVHHDGDLRDIVDWPHGSETDGFVFTKYNSVVNAFYYRALVLMNRFAKDMGNASDEAYYLKKATSVKKAYQKMFFNGKTGIYVDGDGTDHSSLHTNMFAMALGLVDQKYQPKVLEFIKSRGMKASVYGAQFLLDAVYDAGDADYGLSLLTSKSDRGWYNMIKVGSSITLEAWDNKYKPNQDWNHAWGAAAGNIISRKLMGIEPLTPGWDTFSIKPQTGSLDNASIDVPTIKGTIKVACQRDGVSFVMNVNIPANTTAQVYLPLKKTGKYQVWMDDKKVKGKVVGQTILLDKVGSGEHCFTITYL